MAKIITARYPASCSRCGGAISRGRKIRWDPVVQTAMHLVCLPNGKVYW